MMFAGMISWAEEPAGQSYPPVVAAIAPKSGNENVDSAVTNDGNFWKKFNEWETLKEGKNGTPKDEVKAGQILTELIKGVYLVKFGPAEGFNPQTPGEYIQVFYKTSSLKSTKNRLGGAGIFRTKRENNKLIASFLTEQPDKMKQDVEINPQLVFISSEEITPDKFIAHVKSVQESLQNKLAMKSGPPVVAAIAPKSGNENVDVAATNNGFFMQKYHEWEGLMEGKNGVSKDEVKAGQILTELIKGVYLVKFGPAEGFNPQTMTELIKVLYSTPIPSTGNERLGNFGFPVPTSENNKLMLSFLSERPDQMKQYIEKNPKLAFITMEEITPDKFIAHEKSFKNRMQDMAVQQPAQKMIPFRYSVQAEEEVACEIKIDGKLVSTGKTQKQTCYFSLAATPGDHVLTVIAPGYETWQKTITLLEGSKGGQNFLIELKKPTK